MVFNHGKNIEDFEKDLFDGIPLNRCAPDNQSQIFYSPINLSGNPKTYQKDLKILEFEKFSEKAFHSRRDLFSIDIKNQISEIKAYLDEKMQFLESFYQEICCHPLLDLLKSNSESNNPFKESSFFSPLNENRREKLKNLKGLIVAAVDGGLGIREFHGLDLTLIKSVVVEYDFKNPLHPKIGYFPSRESDANFALYTDYGLKRSKNVSALASFRRILAENTMIFNYIIQKLKEKSNEYGEIKKDDSDFEKLPSTEAPFRSKMIIILDGSIHLPPNQHFYFLINTFPKLCLEVIESYRLLYELCSRYKIWLVGSVKDSRTSQMRDLIVKNFPSFLKMLNLKYDSSVKNSFLQYNYRQQFLEFSDYELLYRIMRPGTRTVIIKDSRNFRINLPSLSSLPFQNHNEARIEQEKVISNLLKTQINYSVLYSYVRLSSRDLPLRFELYCPDSKDNEMTQTDLANVIELLAPISSIEPSCTLPLPQIEAHLRAHLSEKEVDFILNPLITHLNNDHSVLHKSEGMLIKNKNPRKTSQKSSELENIHTGTTDFSDLEQLPIISSRHSRLDLLF